MLARFQAQCPGVSIELRFGNREHIAGALTNGDLDLAVMGRPPETADVVATDFAAHPSILIASPTHRLAAAQEWPAFRWSKPGSWRNAAPCR